MENNHSDKKSFYFTFEISIIPTILATAAILLSIWQFYYQTEQNKQAKSNWIGVRIDPYYKTNVKIIKGDGSFDDYFYRKKLKITFTNNGYRKANIVDWQFYLPIKVDEKNEGKILKLWIPGIEPKMKNSNNQEIFAPLNIEPGSSKAVVLEYSVGIPEFAYEQLSDKVKQGSMSDFRNINKELNNIYKKREFIEYQVDFLKGNGDQFAVRFSDFGTKGFMQGEKSPDMRDDIR